MRGRRVPSPRPRTPDAPAEGPRTVHRVRGPHAGTRARRAAPHL